MAFLATCMVMCVLWFLVTELSRNWPSRHAPIRLPAPSIAAPWRKRPARDHAQHPLCHLPCMIVLDIDHFKHLKTRAVTPPVTRPAVPGQPRSTMMRVNDVLARTGGEEFTILLPNTTASAGIMAAERVRQTVEALEIPFEDEPIRFTISAGVAQLDPAQGGWKA